MNLPLILFFLCCIGLGAAKRTPLYDSFAEGAKEGLQTSLGILPSLIAMLCAIRAFSASGLMDMLGQALYPALRIVGIPRETLPLMLLRPLSGSASLAALKDILRACGPDSRAGMVASVMMGSSETVFYTCCVYLGAAGVKKSRHIIPCALLAWLAGCVAGSLVVSG